MRSANIGSENTVQYIIGVNHFLSRVLLKQSTFYVSNDD